MAASYRNDDRQQYVNAVAYGDGEGLGTAPWDGVPGTAFDFSHSNREAYQAFASKSHGGGGHGGGHGGGYGEGGPGRELLMHWRIDTVNSWMSSCWQYKP